MTIQEQERVINRDASKNLRMFYGRSINGRTRAPDAIWLMRQPVHGMGSDNQPAQICRLPDLQGREIVALALRAQGYGQKAVARRVGVDQAIWRNFLLRNAISPKSIEAVERSNRERKLTVKEVDRRLIERIALRVANRVARQFSKEFKRDYFIGPIWPKYWQNVQVNRLRSSESARAHFARYKHDPEFKLRRYTRSRIYNAIKLNHAIKLGRTRQLLGCDLVTLKAHLEAQFKPGMTWGNYGPAWHIDHIKPIVSFDLTQTDQQFAAFHFSNLQPLWADDNRRKGSRMHGSKIAIRRKRLSGTTTPGGGVNSSQGV